PVKLVPAGPMYMASAFTDAAGAGHEGVAPGEIASLYGLGLGPTVGVTGSVVDGQLVRTIGTVSLIVNDIPAPLFYVSEQQINFQVPYEVSGQLSARITLSVSGTPAHTVTLPVVASAPGVFPSEAGWAVLNQDYALNSSDNPAPAGSAVIVYCTGLGAAAPAV